MKNDKVMHQATSLLRMVSLALLVAGIMIITPLQAEEKKVLAPDFTLKSRSGENLKLSEFRGELVMINFWASWCGPCRQEMPELERLYQRYKSLGFTILGINQDDKPRNAEKMLKQIPVSFPILFDEKHEVSDQYHVAAMPTTILLNRDGTIRDIHQGYRPGMEADYQKQIEEMIKE